MILWPCIMDYYQVDIHTLPSISRYNNNFEDLYKFSINFSHSAIELFSIVAIRNLNNYSFQLLSNDNQLELLINKLVQNIIIQYQETTTMPGNKFFDENTLNSPPKIIIKKENIGLEEYQHQKYQFNLFNNTRKRDQYYEDLGRVKDRLEKAVPSMKQVAHADMKRINTNKVYERKLERDLTGPRGLNWQRK
ncbi:unnamed protein product [Rotaria sp. Silwood1]|nr:unnamed protein product [Rotaria sp. Silwood1]